MNSGTVFQSRLFGVGTELNILFLFFATKIDIVSSKSVESQPPRPLHSLLKRCVRLQKTDFPETSFLHIRQCWGKNGTHIWIVKKDPILSSTSRKILPHSSRELFLSITKIYGGQFFPSIIFWLSRGETCLEILSPQLNIIIPSSQYPLVTFRWRKKDGFIITFAWHKVTILQPCCNIGTRKKVVYGSVVV